MQKNQLYLVKSGDNGFMEVTETLVSVTGGNVGIGTNDPPAALSIHNAEPFVQFTDTDVNATGYLKCSNGSFYLQADTANNQSNSVIRFDVDGAERATINSYGLQADKIGIGTNDPPAALSIHDAEPFVQFTDTDVNATGYLKCSNGSFYLQADTSNNQSNSLISFAVDGAECVRIDSDGNLGIGTNNPDARLEVADADEKFVNLRLRHKSANSSYNAYTVLQSTGSAGAYGSNFTIKTRDEDNGLLRDRFHIDQYGRVGLGTASPARALSIRYANPWVELIESGDGAIGGMKFQYGRLHLQADAGNISSNSYIGFEVDGDERARIDSDGKFGIGGADPADYNSEANDLVISTGGRHAGMTIVSSGVPNARANIYFASGRVGSDQYRGGLTYDHGDDNLSLRTATTEKVWISSDGNVGIGTNDPDSQLQIHSSSQRGLLKLTGPYGNEGGDIALLQLGGPNQANNYSGCQLVCYRGGNDHDLLGLKFRVHSSVLHTDPPIDALTIDHHGDVGIGTTIPGSILTTRIATGVPYTNSAPTAATSALALVNNPPSEAANQHATIHFNLNGGSLNHVGSISLVSESAGLRRGALAFCTDGGVSRPEAMRISSAGNVGIGTTEPSAKLDVRGNLLLASGSPSNTSALDSTGSLEIWADRGDGGSSTKITFNVDDSQNVAVMRGVGVGIGTTSYDERLHVVSTSTSQATTNIKNTNVTDGESRGLIITAGNGPSDYSFHARNRAGTESILYARGDGNVGIGTATPAAKLHIEGGAGIGEYSGLMLNKGPSHGQTVFKQYYADGSNWGLKLNDGAGNDRVTFNMDDGNVGIGTTDPDYSLDVHTPNGGGIGVKGASDTNYGWRLKPAVNDLQIAQNGLADRVTFKDGGNVGIGSAEPSSRLEIGDARDLSPDSSWSGSQFGIGANGYKGGIAFNATGMVIGHNSDVRDIQFVTRDPNPGGGAPAPQARLTIAAGADGNVGIGTTAPSGSAGSLHVNGGSVIVPTESSPPSEVKGAIYFNGTNFKGWNGTSWVTLG